MNFLELCFGVIDLNLEKLTMVMHHMDRVVINMTRVRV